MVDVITMLDKKSPDFLLLTETPLPPPPHSGALLQALRNRGYKVHHHPSNAPFQPDGLPEARLPDHITNLGGGCWLAYKKHTSWTTSVSPLILPIDCPGDNVELTLFDGTKAAIISCYLPPTVEAHSNTCATLAQLPHTLPHPLIILGGDLQRGWEKRSQKDLQIATLPFKRWARPTLPIFTPRQQPGLESCIDHLTIYITPPHHAHKGIALPAGETP